MDLPLPDQEKLPARATADNTPVEQLETLQAPPTPNDQPPWRHRTPKLAERMDTLHVRVLQPTRLLNRQRVDLPLLPGKPLETRKGPAPLLPRKPKLRQLVNVDVRLRVPKLQPNPPQLPPRKNPTVRVLENRLPMPLPLEPRKPMNRRPPPPNELLLGKELPQPQQKELPPPVKLREKQLKEDAQPPQLQKVQPMEPLKERPPLHVKLPPRRPMRAQKPPTPRLLHQKEVPPPPKELLPPKIGARKLKPLAKKERVQTLDPLPLPNRANGKRRRLQLYQHPLVRPIPLLLLPLLPMMGRGPQGTPKEEENEQLQEELPKELKKAIEAYPRAAVTARRCPLAGLKEPLKEPQDHRQQPQKAVPAFAVP